MTDRPSQWAIEQAVKLIAATISAGRVTTGEESEQAIDKLARALDAMVGESEPPIKLDEGLGYGGVVRSHHDGD